MRFSVELSRKERRADHTYSTLPALLKWILYGQTNKTSSGESVDQESALKLSAVFACFRILGETIGSLPVNVYSVGMDGSRNIAFDHPVQSLIKGEPNPYMTSFVWRELIMNHLNGWGNHYAKIERNGAYLPSSITPVHPSKVKKIEQVKSGLLYHIDGQDKPVKQENMIHVTGFSYDGILGKSPIEIAAENIGLGITLQKFGAEFFANGAVMSGKLKHPGKLSDTALKHLKDSLKEQHTGEGKRHQPIVLEEGMDWIGESIAPEAAQFILSRKFQLNEIARIFRIPPHMLADLERSTNNNIEHQGIEFVQHTILPWCIRIEQELNRKLFTEEEKRTGKTYIRFNLNGLLRGDITARTAHYTAMLDRGVYNVNEVRAMEDKNGIGQDGDQYYKQVNTAPVEIINQTQNNNGEAN